MHSCALAQGVSAPCLRCVHWHRKLPPEPTRLGNANEELEQQAQLAEGHVKGQTCLVSRSEKTPSHLSKLIQSPLRVMPCGRQ